MITPAEALQLGISRRRHRRLGRPSLAARLARRSELDKCRFDFLDFGFGLFFQAHQRIPSSLVDPDQLVEFELKRLRVTILRVLDHEDHQKRDNRGCRIDDELPGIGPAKEGARNQPHTDTQKRQHKRGRAAELLLNPAREAGEDRPLWRSIVYAMLMHRKRDG